MTMTMRRFGADSQRAQNFPCVPSRYSCPRAIRLHDPAADGDAMSAPVRSAVRPLSPRIVPEMRSGALRPAEVANAGVFSALAVIIVSVGTFLPHLGVIMLLSAVPFAIVGLRHRVRAVVAAAVAAGFVAFIVAGAFATIVVAGCALLGGPCGIMRRHGRG